MKTLRLSEDAHGGPGGHDPAAGVVRDCKVLGLVSRNGRRYSRRAVASAARLYEGCPVYFDHDEGAEGRSRPFIDKFGTLRNVRVGPDGGLRGDLHYNPRHLYADTFRGWLETDPNGVGFSHNATGRVREDHDGTFVVEEIVEVESVDLVSRPATTEGLFEAHDTETCKVEEETPLDMPAETPAEAGAGGYEDHLAEMVKAIVTDPALDPKVKKKKILAALKMLDAKGGGEEVEDVEEAEEEAPEEKKEESEEDKYEKAEESLRKSKDPDVALLLESLDSYRVRERLRELQAKAHRMCSDARLPVEAVTPTFVRQLCEARDDEARAELIRDRQSVQRLGRPPVSRSGGGKPPALTVDELLAGF